MVVELEAGAAGMGAAKFLYSGFPTSIIVLSF